MRDERKMCPVARPRTANTLVLKDLLKGSRNAPNVPSQLLAYVRCYFAPNASRVSLIHQPASLRNSKAKDHNRGKNGKMRTALTKQQRPMTSTAPSESDAMRFPQQHTSRGIFRTRHLRKKKVRPPQRQLLNNIPLAPIDI